MLHNVEKTFVTVSVDGELVCQEVYVDVPTGLDIDPYTGVFRTRTETEALIQDVYRVGRNALPKELERYNRWMQEGSHSYSLQSFSNRLVTAVSKANSSADGKSKPEEAEEWRSRGNDAMRHGDARKAAYCYSEGLCHKPLSCVFWANRAAAMLKLGRCDCALSDAERAIELDPTNVKAYFRKVTSLCMLGARGAASRCLKECVEKFGIDAAWQSLEKRILAMSAALLVDCNWICTENVAEGEVVCTLEGIKLPNADPYEVLRIWKKNGIPEEILAKEAAYYADRGLEPEFEPYSAVIEAQKIFHMWLDVDSEVISEANLKDILRWCCILLEPVKTGMAADKGSFLEKIFGDGYVFLGASLFSCSNPCDANVDLFFDQETHFLRVIARRSIRQYETLFSLSSSDN